eukprot:jgi/Bigna1/126834/aug1.3_g1542
MAGLLRMFQKSFDTMLGVDDDPTGGKAKGSQKIRDEDEKFADEFRDQILPIKRKIVARLDEAQAQLMEEIKIIKEIQSIYETLKEAYRINEDEDIPQAVQEIEKLASDLENSKYLNGEVQLQTHKGTYIKWDYKTVDASSRSAYDSKTVFKVDVKKVHPVKITLKAEPGYLRARRGGSPVPEERLAFGFVEVSKKADTEYAIYFLDKETICLRTEHELWMSADVDGNVHQAGHLESGQKFSCPLFMKRRHQLIEKLESRLKRFEKEGLAWVPEALPSISTNK